MSMLLKLSFLLFALACVPCQSQDPDEEEPGQDEEPQEGPDDGSEAPPSPERLKKLHTKIDKNGDGKVSHEELLDFHKHFSKASAHKEMIDAKTYESVDADHDGKVSLEEQLKFTHEDPEHQDMNEEEAPPPVDEEFKAEMERSKKLETAKFKVADTNGDGMLSQDEWLSLNHPEANPALVAVAVKAAMDEKDTDKDGKLSPKEFLGNNGVDPDEDAPEAGAVEVEDDFFIEHDLDKNGFIDLKELESFEFGFKSTEDELKELVTSMDENSDGHMTADELADAFTVGSTKDPAGHYLVTQWMDHHEL